MPLNAKDIARLASDVLEERFGENIDVDIKNGQVIACFNEELVPCRASEECEKFSEKMEYLSSNDDSKLGDIEIAFQKALIRSKLIFKIRNSEKRGYIPAPPVKFKPLEHWSAENYANVRETIKKWTDCYKTIERWLNMGHPTPWAKPKIEEVPETQRKLSWYFDIYRGGAARRVEKILETFGKPERKRHPTLGLRFDIIYEPMKRKLLFSEIKPAATIRPGELMSRAAQLSAYDAFLNFAGDDKTPIAYILPTNYSYLEKELVTKVSNARQIIPICITTEYFLRKDLESRMETSEWVLRPENTDASPELIERHKSELKFLESFGRVVC